MFNRFRITKFGTSLVMMFVTIAMSLNVVAFGASPKLNWITDFQSGLRQAQQENKFMFVDLSADWCQYCKQMDKNVLHDSEVVSFLSQYVTVRLDYDSQFGQSLKRRYGIAGVPCIMLFDSTGKLRDKLDGAPKSSADFIRYVAKFSQSDGSQYAQNNAASPQAPAVPFPAAFSGGQGQFQPAQSATPAWNQAPPQNNWLGQPVYQQPMQYQPYQGNQSGQLAPFAQPPQYSGQPYPGQQYSGQQYPGAQMPPPFSVPPQYPMQSGQPNQNSWPKQSAYPQGGYSPTGYPPAGYPQTAPTGYPQTAPTGYPQAPQYGSR